MMPFYYSSKSSYPNSISIYISDFTLVVGGRSSNYSGSYYSYSDAVEVVSPDPLLHEVPQCIKTLGNFPTGISGAVGTTFGKLKKCKLKGRRGLIK